MKAQLQVTYRRGADELLCSSNALFAGRTMVAVGGGAQRTAAESDQGDLMTSWIVPIESFGEIQMRERGLGNLQAVLMQGLNPCSKAHEHGLEHHRRLSVGGLVVALEKVLIP